MWLYNEEVIQENVLADWFVDGMHEAKNKDESEKKGKKR